MDGLLIDLQKFYHKTTLVDNFLTDLLGALEVIDIAQWKKGRNERRLIKGVFLFHNITLESKVVDEIASTA